MNGNWDRQLPPAAACGISLEGGAASTAVPGRLGISHVYLSPCLQAVPGSQHGYDVTDPTADQRRPRRRIRLGEVSWSARASISSESSSTSCRITCPLRSTIRGGITCSRMGRSASLPSYFDVRNRPHQPFRVHLCFFGAPLWSRRRGGRTHDRDRARAAARSPLREYLAARARLLGQAAVGGPRAGADGTCCFGDLERLQAIDEPEAKDRTAYASRAAASRGGARGCAERGRLQAAVGPHTGRPATGERGAAAAVLLAARWKLAGNSATTGVFSTSVP